MTDRWIHLDGLVNMRDVGGLPTADGGRTVPGRLIRSDNLQDLTEADVDRLVRELGVTDVVDLRTETELHLEGPGPLRRTTVRHHHHSLLPQRPPMSADEVAARALALPSADETVRDASFWSEHYLGYLARRPDSVSAALRIVAEARGATLVHCAAGKDRTGTVVALALDVAGVPRDAIVADYVLSAERIERIIERIAGTDAHGPALAGQTVDDQTPKAGTMTTILDAVADGWGDAAGWLRDQGWSDDDVQRLRARLTRP